MRLKIYDNPKEAYDLLNKANEVKVDYEEMFRERNPYEVLILFDRKKRPTNAWVRYRIGNDECIMGLGVKRVEDRPDITDKLR